MWHPQKQFPESVLLSSKAEKIQYFENILTDHSIFVDCLADLKRVLFKRNRYPVINVFGPTGVGKTELARIVEKYGFEAHKEMFGQERIHVGIPAVYVPVRMSGDKSFNWKSFYSQILESLNAPPEKFCKAVLNPIYSNRGRGYSTRPRDTSEVRRELEKRILELGLKVLILDEIQHFFKFSGRNKDDALEILKSLATLSECQIILTGTYQSLRDIAWSGQLARRTKKIHFRRYGWEHEQEKFASAYTGLLSHIPHELDDGLFSHAAVEYVYKVSCGCVGILKQLLERGLDRNQFDEPLSLSDLMAEAMGLPDLIQIAREINEGEKYFLSGTQGELEGLLGIRKNRYADSDSAPEVAKVKPKPGQRSPKRDRVGRNV